MRNVQESLIGHLTSAVTEAKTTEQLTRPLLTLLEAVTGLESTYLTSIDETAGFQRILFSRNSKDMQIPEGLSVPWGDTLCKRALDEGRPFTEDVSECWGDSEAARALGIKTYVSTPVYMADGRIFGTLCAASKDQHQIDDKSRNVLSLFGSLISQNIQREHLLNDLQEANRKLEEQSLTDMLTGLPNRRSIYIQLDQMFARARREGRNVYVVFIDLDNFKAINDLHSHETGDAFLTQVGERLTQGVRKSDLLGRLGGDEFVLASVASPADEDHQEAMNVWHERLSDLIQGTYELGDVKLEYAGASFGMICIDPSKLSPLEALKQADASMYAAKGSRK